MKDEHRAKIWFVVIASLLTFPLMAQPLSKRVGDSLLVRDSVVWRVAGVENVGVSSCRHEWVAGDSAWVCWSIVKKEPGELTEWEEYARICRKCLRKERMRQTPITHWEPVGLTEYEKLDRAVRRLTPNKRGGRK